MWTIENSIVRSSLLFIRGTLLFSSQHGELTSAAVTCQLSDWCGLIVVVVHIGLREMKLFLRKALLFEHLLYGKKHSGLRTSRQRLVFLVLIPFGRPLQVRQYVSSRRWQDHR